MAETSSSRCENIVRSLIPRPRSRGERCGNKRRCDSASCKGPELAFVEDNDPRLLFEAVGRFSRGFASPMAGSGQRAHSAGNRGTPRSASTAGCGSFAHRAARVDPTQRARDFEIGQKHVGGGAKTRVTVTGKQFKLPEKTLVLDPGPSSLYAPFFNSRTRRPARPDFSVVLVRGRRRAASLQRRFVRPIFAHDGVDLAAANLENITVVRGAVTAGRKRSSETRGRRSDEGGQGSQKKIQATVSCPTSFRPRKGRSILPSSPHSKCPMSAIMGLSRREHRDQTIYREVHRGKGEKPEKKKKKNKRFVLEAWATDQYSPTAKRSRGLTRRDGTPRVPVRKAPHSPCPSVSSCSIQRPFTVHFLLACGAGVWRKGVSQIAKSALAHVKSAYHWLWQPPSASLH